MYFLSFFSVATAVGDTMSLFECSSPFCCLTKGYVLSCVELFSPMYGKALKEESGIIMIHRKYIDKVA